MALTHEQINNLFGALPVHSYRQETFPKPVTLSPDIAAALGSIGITGTKKRKLLRVLTTVIDAIANKLFVERIISIDTAVDSVVSQWLTANQWESLQRKLYRAVARDGETYILVSFVNEQPVFSLRDSYDGRNGAAYVYRNCNSNEALYAVNTWYEGTTRYLDVYYPERIEKYININDGNWQRRADYEGELWPLEWVDTQGQPLGIALVKFDIGGSDIEEAIQVQADINDALLDLLATSRTMGFPQRYIKGTTHPEYLLNQYGQPLTDPLGMPVRRNMTTAPGAIFMLQGKETEFGQLPPADINTSVIDKLLHLLSFITKVPSHYFDGQWPSGVALQNSEMQLNALVESHQGELTPAVEGMLRLSLRLANTFANTRYDTAAGFDIHWSTPVVVTEDLRLDQMIKTAQAILTLESAKAISLEQKVRMLHEDWDEAQVQDEVARIKAEQAIVSL